MVGTRLRNSQWIENDKRVPTISPEFLYRNLSIGPLEDKFMAGISGKVKR